MSQGPCSLVSLGVAKYWTALKLLVFRSDDNFALKALRQEKMATEYYRPDVDGLRAIAILGVILSHAGLPISGGYVGVDVFFVISGYLITQIILRESSEQRFSLMNFWMRRIRRILPAAVVVTLTTIFVGYFCLDPLSYNSLGQAAIAQSLMIANILFWRRSGYFAESSYLDPLLHTWSLSVEEQFYMVYPILLLFLLRKPRFTFIVLAVAAFGSFFLSSIGTYIKPSATFYLLPTRAWELAAGALLAISESRFTMRGVAKQILALAGLGAILFPMVIYSDSTSFPGLAALPPVAGTIILLAANRGSPTLVARILSLKPVVAIGLASYSLYLWHWPILVFLRHTLVRQSELNVMVALGCTAVISYISWRFVEVPFRSSKKIRSAKASSIFGLLTSSAVIAAGAHAWFHQGIKSWVTPELSTKIEDIYWRGDEYSSDSPSGVPIGFARDDKQPPDFVLWGDSHGMVVSNLVNLLANEHGKKGVALLSSGECPIPGVWRNDCPDQEGTMILNQKRMDFIMNSGTQAVILVGRWDGYVNGSLSSEGNTFDMRIRDSSTLSVTPSESRNALMRQFSKMQTELARKNIAVWLLLQVPASSRPEVARDFYQKHRFPLINPGNFRLDTSREHYEQSRQLTLNLFRHFESFNFHIVDPIEVFFASTDRLELYSTRAHYRDEDHLTQFGAEHYLYQTFSDIFSRIK